MTIHISVDQLLDTLNGLSLVATGDHYSTNPAGTRLFIDRDQEVYQIPEGECSLAMRAFIAQRIEQLEQAILGELFDSIPFETLDAVKVDQICRRLAPLVDLHRRGIAPGSILKLDLPETHPSLPLLTNLLAGAGIEVDVHLGRATTSAPAAFIAMIASYHK